MYIKAHSSAQQSTAAVNRGRPQTTNGNKIPQNETMGWNFRWSPLSFILYGLN